MVRSGELRYKIKFVEFPQERVPGGGSLPTTRNPFTLDESWSKVTPLKNVRTVQANQEVLNSGYEIIVRYKRNFTPLKTMFIKYKDLVMTITSIQQYDENREFWQIIAMISK